MRYFNCQKKKAFELFDQGFLPSQIYDRVKVKRHTLFNYYQQWKREQEWLNAEAERKRLAKENEDKLRTEKLQKEFQLQNQYQCAKKEIWKLCARNERATHEAERAEINEAFQEAFSKLCELSIQLYPDCTDVSSIIRKTVSGK